MDKVSQPIAIALNRFGLGARADEAPPADPKGWLLAQFDVYDPRPAPWRARPSSSVLAADLAQRRMAVAQDRKVKPGDDRPGREQPDAQAARKALAADIRDDYRDAVGARVESALTTPTPFVERLVHFWANHFAVSAEKPAVAALAGSFEAEAIRPHVLGRFEDMLVAVEQHPAMQLFLDQPSSVGPHSKAVQRAERRDPSRSRGLNENLAREIMELHTLGARTGYTQADVTEFARALTGWSIAGARGARPDDAAPGAFVFRAGLHEPGARTIMGRQYAQAGVQQPLAVLRDLAASPDTARHISLKLARHFIADNPPPEAVDRLARTYVRGGGDLSAMYRELVDMPQAWMPASVKFKTPWEWLISAMRGLGTRSGPRGAPAYAGLLAQLGQPVWRPGSPAGYDDVAAAWAAPDALVRRVEAAQRLAARVNGAIDPRELARALFAGTAGRGTVTAVARAESVQTAIALLLVSPDFQRR
ncbi:DUF1800 domain-containing protein [Bordetella sputigena]|uniref:DUF1800 domain-containing protein n=1 Tax=Bordetella sputigena TaxID=1416810 RepID=UPI0039EE470B